MAEFGERRVIPLTLADVPPLFIHALLDTEDKRFYSHGGVDFISLLNDSIELRAEPRDHVRRQHDHDAAGQEHLLLSPNRPSSASSRKCCSR